MTVAFDLVMTEHAAWRSTGSVRERVFRVTDGGLWLAAVNGRTLTLNALAPGRSAPALDIFAVSAADGVLKRRVPELASALTGVGAVGRFRNSDLWDAVGLAIIRQVVRAGQSKRMYRTFSATYGEQVPIPGGDRYALFPSPDVVLGLKTEQFSSVGMAFKCAPLKAAAEAYLLYGDKWHELPPEVLTQALQEVPRIGPWTAHAAVADWCNDWSLYPYSDLAVRTWAKRAAPSFDWPTDDAAFGRAWRLLAGDQLSPLTLLTLAWGSQHGDIG